jgi:hypothetical protein
MFTIGLASGIFVGTIIGFSVWAIGRRLELQQRGQEQD